MQGELLFLGTGASAGVPRIGCYCSVCTSKNPKNRRARPSVLVTVQKKRLLIDVGPDFHAQAIQHRLDDLDGVLLTHTHYDHIAGIDELRAYYLLYHKRLPVLLSKASFEELSRRYDYIVSPKEDKGFAALLDFVLLPSLEGKIDFIDVPVDFVTYFQLGMQVTGYRFGNLAYLSDMRDFSESIFEQLSGVETLIISALRHKSSPFHLTIDEAVAFIKKTGAKRSFLMHLSHDIDHDKVESLLPKGIMLAYDGLKVGFDESIPKVFRDEIL